MRAIATQLKSGKNVQNRKLQTWLTEEEYAQIAEGWQEQLNAREELKNKPSAVKEYEEILRLATLYYNRSEGYSTRGYHNAAKKFYYGQ